MPESVDTQALGADQPAKPGAGPKKRVQRHSPDRLLRRPVQLVGGVTVSAERHKGRIMVRFELPDEVDNLGDPASLPQRESGNFQFNST
jgi:hypothetical protein